MSGRGKSVDDGNVIKENYIVFKVLFIVIVYFIFISVLYFEKGFVLISL